MTPENIMEHSEVEIVNKDLYDRSGTRKPVPYGPLDRRMGVSDKSSVCETCGETLQDCVGHFGYLKLALPVFHAGYFKATMNILQAICKGCARVLLTEEEKEVFKRRLSRKLDNIQRGAVWKGILDQCKKKSVCPYCEGPNGTVKKIERRLKVNVLRFIHDKYKNKKASEEKEIFHEQFETAGQDTPELKNHLNKAMEDLNPLKVLELFKRIPDQDVFYLCMNSEIGRPENYVWQHVPFPPACIRPSVAMQQDGGSNEDDITMKLTEIVYTNQIIADGLKEGNPVNSMMEDWEFLQIQCALLINSQQPGLPISVTGGRPIRAFCQRLKGKQGRFRGNLSGKRVDFSSRTVISPDPNLSIDQVGVPLHVAKMLTFPERVYKHNMKELKRAIMNGPDIHPGANYIIQGKTGLKKYLKYGDRRKIADSLKEGDIVERHLRDGDAVLFNRQPSLHKLSIMCHQAKVKPWRTFRFNECVCSPYNADFDGDEMNLHLPQTEEARAEALELMGVKNNLVTPRNGQPIIAATQDFITASYLITNKDVFYTKSQFSQICLMFCDSNIKLDLVPPCIIKPIKLWSGKQVINMLIRPNRESEIVINLENKGRTFSKPKGIPDMCENDGYLVIFNSEIMCGTLDKAHIGDGNKGSLFYVVLRDYGPLAAAECMNRIAKLCARWLANRGFSIGINDVQPGFKLRKEKDNLVVKGYNECDFNIQQFKLGNLQNQPGCNAEQTLESKISGILSKIRDDVGQICLQELRSKINVSQMVACVGQQIISGQRIPDGFTCRSLPHFGKNSKIPSAKGFVRNSFYSGLTPTEFFFHAVSGREGLVDTAVKTAETGYMQRRLMKALEDLSAHYDGSVRNSIDGIIQFKYGDDGLDPANMEGQDKPVHFWHNLLHSVHYINGQNDPGLTIDEINLLLKEKIKLFNNCSNGFKDQLKSFINEEIISKISNLIQKFPKYNFNEISKIFKVTEKQMELFFDICLNKYSKAKMEPGTAVGALGAQSIGEPGTQMTLKTFHFAGVASMNITLGVPRIKEIINASKAISTPIITTKLVNDQSIPCARIVKGRIEKTLLGDVMEYIEQVFTPDECYLLVSIDMNAIMALQLEIDLYSIQQSIIKSKLKINPQCVIPREPNLIKIAILQSNDLFYSIQQIKRQLPDIIIKGIPTVSRAVINDLGGSFNLLVEGNGLAQVMTIDGVIGTETTSNDVIEVEKTLGIEAARSCIINEIQYTMGKHGMTIDARHVMLLGDIMSFKGQVLGITRFGISKMKDSVLMLASFEKTTDHLFEAAVFSKKDAINGVSECIIMGIPMPIGTGMFKLQNNIDLSPGPQLVPIFESIQ
ncbi:beta and beta-prime subunits of DNA dependent RNA-polymerase [Rozella allomycis CSF55]|uniref:DNA-directed RNA polymerase subunit n=1 Tax=Rozella allomycis (strain CSF55) TaxID=988480 RepID=A0A4P9YG36_ROZAC|nr:beta and beta-prime subunits of DNA dependent RNA-polymerase [Rozella allomycis CSF55]